MFAVMFIIGLVIRMLPKSVHNLAAEGNIRAFRKIAKSQGNPGLEAVAPDGGTPLYLAALNGHEELVKLLLSHDVSVTPRPTTGKRRCTELRRMGIWASLSCFLRRVRT